MLNLDELPVIINRSKLDNLLKKKKKLERELSLHRSAITSVGRFMTYLYNKDEKFKHYREQFNSSFEDAQMVLDDNKIKIKLNED